MNPKQRFFAFCASLISLGAASVIAPAPARAKQAAPPAATGTAQFGSVDVNQILSESKARQKDVAEINALSGTFRNVLQQLQTGAAHYLSEAEIREYATLLEKPTPTDADKKRIAALQAGADAKSAQMTRLENVAAPTDEQKKQFTDLSDTRQKGDDVVKAIADDMSKRFDLREGDLRNKTVLDIRGVIAKVAQDKGLSVVFDSSVALYTANDITAEVIKQINNKK